MKAKKYKKIRFPRNAIRITRNPELFVQEFNRVKWRTNWRMFDREGNVHGIYTTRDKASKAAFAYARAMFKKTPAYTEYLDKLSMRLNSWERIFSETNGRDSEDET